jgi:hypothetical protein
VGQVAPGNEDGSGGGGNVAARQGHGRAGAGTRSGILRCVLSSSSEVGGPAGLRE